MDSSARDDRLLDLARRLLDGEAIDWAAEGIEESEVREGMKRLQPMLRMADGTETATGKVVVEKVENRFIGDFRLVRKLGEGGMGVVYEAEQQHPKRPVALKVIRGGRHVEDHALRLFQREIQTLARLSHPGIAQLYEAGVTDDGMHFFAMELIRGEPLSEWLRKRSRNPVTPEEIRFRLGLFRKICDAVAYAHQKGVIHRDLKPGNILIPKAKSGSSMPDAVPEVKILDFGLARMTDTDVQMTTYVTEMGKVQGTLPYMSPEQIRGNPDEIDLRTDVYSLGVLLYEMVTGHLPYDFSKAQLPDAARIICEEAPRSISTTFSGTHRLDVDVATIAGKCLEKETARRYQSAAALGEDVQRYLTDQPILARPPSTAYQFRKLVHRHRGPFAAAAGAFVLLLAFATTMTVQAARIAKERDRANHERDRANQEAETSRRVSEFLEGLFKVSDPWSARDKEVSPRELLDDGAERVESELKDQPGVQARLMKTIGVAYQGLGVNDRAQRMLTLALPLTERAFGGDSLEYAEALHALGGFLNQSGESVERHRKALEIRLRLLPPDDPRIARSYWHLGVAQLVEGDAQAEETLRKGLEVAERSSPRDEQVQLFLLNELTFPCYRRRDYECVLEIHKEAMTIRERLYHEGHPDRIQGPWGLAYALLLLGRYDEAESYLRPAVHDLERELGPDHPTLANALHSLGELERRMGKLAEARRSLERSLRIYEKAVATDDPSFIDPLTSLGLVDEAQGRLGEAVRQLGKAASIYLRSPGLCTLEPLPEYARVLRKSGRIAEAERIEAAALAGSAK